MPMLLRLYLEFMLIGLFSIGGGLATLPFIKELMHKTGWFTMTDISNMIAVSECTPGPFGVNMATYVGNTISGPVGGIIATLGLITPALVIIILVSKILNKFKDALIVKQIMYGLRPGSTGLVAVAVCSVASAAFLDRGRVSDFAGPFYQEFFMWIVWRDVFIGAAIFVLILLGKKKKVHPVVYIAGAAILGIVLKL